MNFTIFLNTEAKWECLAQIEPEPRYNMYYLHISKNATKIGRVVSKSKIYLVHFYYKSNMAMFIKINLKKSTRTGHTLKKN